jgi:hypothetical protein
MSAASSLTLDPRRHFVVSESPVFAKPECRQLLPRPLAHPSINPRDRDAQYLRNITDGQKLGFGSLHRGRVALRRGIPFVLTIPY